MPPGPPPPNTTRFLTFSVFFAYFFLIMVSVTLYLEFWILEFEI